MVREATNLGGYEKTTNSMKLMASLAPALAELEAGVLAKADQ